MTGGPSFALPEGRMARLCPSTCGQIGSIRATANKQPRLGATTHEVSFRWR